MSGVGWTGPNAMADPDLQIRRWGGGGPQKKKGFLRPFGPQFGLKIKGGSGPLGPLPWIRHCNAAIWNTAFMFSMCKVVKNFIMERMNLV